MKSKICSKITVIFIFSSFLLSCSENPKTSDSDVEINDNYDAFQKFNLADYDIKASIMLPDETANIGAATKPEVLHEEDGFKWDIVVGQNFNIHIEDWGANRGLVSDRIKRNSELEIYKTTYLIDEPDFIVYKQELNVKGEAGADKSVGVHHESYHIFAEKVIDGITYEFRSPDEGYEKVIIELMAKSIRSVKTNK